MTVLNSRGTRYVLVFGLVFSCCGCATTQRDWEDATQQNTVKAYEEFLENHPRSDQASLAKRRLRQLRASLRQLQANEDWRKAESMNTIDGYRDFYDKYTTGPFPPSKQAKEARRRLLRLQEERDWEETKRVGVIAHGAAYQRFIKKYPGSHRVPEAKKKLEELKLVGDWEKTQKADSIRAFEAFLRAYPSSQYSSKAKDRLASLRKERDERERETAEAIQWDLENGKELPALPIKKLDFARNIVIKAPGSVLHYSGARIMAVGEAFARIPSKGKAWHPISKKDFIIIHVRNIGRLDDVIAHTGRRAIPIGHVTDMANLFRGLTLVVPREIIPCELELKGWVSRRIPFKRKQK